MMFFSSKIISGLYIRQISSLNLNFKALVRIFYSLKQFESSWRFKNERKVKVREKFALASSGPRLVLTSSAEAWGLDP